MKSKVYWFPLLISHVKNIYNATTLKFAYHKEINPYACYKVARCNIFHVNDFVFQRLYTTKMLYLQLTEYNNKHRHLKITLSWFYCFLSEKYIYIYVYVLLNMLSNTDWRLTWPLFKVNCHIGAVECWCQHNQLWLCFT